MSWILRDLWSTLEGRQEEYAAFLHSNRVRAFEVISRIGYEVGQRHGILLQLNFPPGQYALRLKELGHRDLSMLVQRGKEKFEPVSENEVKKVFEQLNPKSFEPLKSGQEGFKVPLSDGIIDCLPSGVHLWCEVTPEILDVLDWLFTNAYGIRPTH